MKTCRQVASRRKCSSPERRVEATMAARSCGPVFMTFTGTTTPFDAALLKRLKFARHALESGQRCFNRRALGLGQGV